MRDLAGDRARCPKRPTVHDAFEVALFLLRLSWNLVTAAAIDELALVPPPDDVVDRGHEAAVEGGGGEGGGAAAAVCASDDADLLLRRAEHADADAAAAAPATSSILDARGKVRRLPGRRRRKCGR